MAKYSVIIKNGTVFDGKGNKPEKVDLAITEDEIKKIGDLSKESADKIIDATDQYVSPGFIDLTNHSDTHWTLFSHPLQESLISQGITTILGGNCGTSLSPFSGQESLEEIGRWTDVSKINIDWQSTDEFFSKLEKTKIGLNFCTLIGLNTLLRVVGNDLKQANFLLGSSLDQGAFGISTNFSLYPAKNLSEENIIDLFKIVGQKNAFTKHHLEDEGENFLPSVARLISLTRKSGVPVHLTHFKALGKNSWPFFPEAIEMINRAREEKLKISCDFFPYTKTGSNLFSLLPPWIKKLSKQEIFGILKSPDDKKRKDLIEYFKKITLHYDRIIIASGSMELKVVGKTVKEISEISGLSGEEVILNLLATNDLRVSIFNEVISLENIELIAKEDFSAIASDGVGLGNWISKGNPISFADLPHPRSFGAFPHAFELFVKEKKLLEWEKIIYKMTGWPAEILGLKNRGTIEKGSKADLVVFSPKEISGPATYENPFQPAQGIKNVLINGVSVLEEKKLTGLFPGRALKKR